MKKSFAVFIFMIFSIASIDVLGNNEQTKPIAKTIGGIIISSGAILYGTIVGPAVTLLGIVDGFDSQVVVGPIVTTVSIPIFYYGYKLLKSGINDLEKLDQQGVANPLKEVTTFILKKEECIKKRFCKLHKN